MAPQQHVQHSVAACVRRCWCVLTHPCRVKPCCSCGEERAPRRPHQSECLCLTAPSVWRNTWLTGIGLSPPPAHQQRRVTRPRVLDGRVVRHARPAHAPVCAPVEPGDGRCRDAALGEEHRAQVPRGHSNGHPGWLVGWRQRVSAAADRRACGQCAARHCVGAGLVVRPRHVDRRAAAGGQRVARA